MAFLGDLRTVLRGRDFRKLFAVRLTSQLADGVFQVALASYVFFSPERQTSASAAAAAFAVLLLPYSVIGPFAGVLLDRWSRRQVLVWANAVRVGMLLVVGVLMAAEIANALFFVAVLSALSVNRFLLAGLSAALPHTVPAEELVMANAVSPTSGTVAFLAGTGLGFGVRESVDVGNPDVRVLVVGAALYAAASALALRLGRHALGPDFDPDRPAVREAVRHVVAGFVAGARYAHQHHRVRAALAVVTVHRMGYAIATLSLILLCRNTFNDPGDADAGLAALALVLGVAGVGVFAAALVTPAVVPRIGTRRWIVGVLIAAAVIQLVVGGLYTWPSTLAAAFTLGLAAQALKICVDTIVQQDTEDAFRGRVFSLYDLLLNVAFVAAAGIAALVLPPSGISYGLLVAVTVGYLAAALGYQRATRGASR